MGTALSRKLGVNGQVPPPLGPEHLGATYFRVPGGSLAKMWYPAEGRRTKHVGGYMRKEAMRGLAQSVGANRAILANLVKTPFYWDPEAEPRAGEQPWEVVIFSHGLKGSCEVYSKVCSDLASLGYVVLALEHEDGSAHFARREGADKPVAVAKPTHEQHSVREGVLAYRRPHLEIRRAEVEAAMELMLDHATPTGNALLDKVLGMIARDKLWLGGHSFGGATTIFSASSLNINARLRGCFLLDVWMHPICDEILDAGLPVPCVSVLSEGFAKWGEQVALLERLMDNTEAPERPKRSFFLEGTVHQQFSDTAFLFNAKLATKVQALGSKPGLVSQEAIVAIVRALLEGASDAEWSTIIKEHDLRELPSTESRALE